MVSPIGFWSSEVAAESSSRRVIHSCYAPGSSDKPWVDDSVYRLRAQDVLTLSVLALLALGVLMVQSAAMNVASRWTIVGTPPDRETTQTFTIDAYGEAKARDWAIQRQIDIVSVEPADADWQWTERGVRHSLYAAIAILTFLLVSRIDYARLLHWSNRTLTNPALWGMVLAIALCGLVLVPGIGHEVNGARRWIKLGPIQLQPSELAKWAVVIYLAWFFTRRPLDPNRFFLGVLPMLAPVGLLCLLVVIQDFGTAALIGLSALVILFVGGARLWQMALLIPPALAAAAWFVMSEPYRWRRMTAFLNPFESPREEGYHMIQSLLSFATGGLGGKGLGNGVQKLGYLPEDTTDFIFAVICEELGIAGALLVVTLYAAILLVSWHVARQRRDQFGRLLAFGVGAVIGLQAAINLAVATVSVPTKGLSLPLVSAGGTGLVITCAALGLLCSVTRHPRSIDERLPRRQADLKPEVVTEKLLTQWTRAA